MKMKVSGKIIRSVLKKSMLTSEKNLLLSEMSLKMKITSRKSFFLSFLYKDNEIVNEVKKDVEYYKSVYFELGKHIPKDANILHIADDFGQKDILLSLQQAGRKIFSYIKDVDKRQIAEQNYLVKKKKNKLY